jgi:polysaccharide chain length determinant protein (PEP-CTERM system associated)
MQEVVLGVFTAIRSALRFRWYGMAIAWIGCLAGWAFLTVMPDVYEAQARVYLDTSSELEPLLRGQIVEKDINSQLAYVQEALLGRDSMERVVDNTPLADRVHDDQDREAMLARLAQSIEVEAAGTNRNQANNLFHIAFRERDQGVALAVVQQLLQVLETSTRSAGQFGNGQTAAFLEQRIAELDQELAEAEQRRADFKREHSDRLPGSEGDYFARMQNEQNALDQARRDLRVAQAGRDNLQAQLDAGAALVPGTPDDGAAPRDSLDARIQDLELEIDSLLLQYTEKHPDVIAAKESLARLREQRAVRLRQLGVDNPDTPISDLEIDPVYQDLRLRLNEADLNIATLQADIKEREANLAELQSLINEVPAVEAELRRLDRDYDVKNDRYQEMVRSLETQKLTQEASGVDNVDFRVIDPPTVSANPVAPDRLLLAAGIFVAALGLGGALCYVLSQIWPVFGSARNLRMVTELPVIGVVTNAYTERRHAEQRRRALVFVSCLVLLTVAFVSVAAIEVVGPGLHSII